MVGDKPRQFANKNWCRLSRVSWALAQISCIVTVNFRSVHRQLKAPTLCRLVLVAGCPGDCFGFVLNSRPASNICPTHLIVHWVYIRRIRRPLVICTGGSRSWSWGARSSAEGASRVEAPKALRGVRCGEGVSKWRIFVDSVPNFVFSLWP